MKKRKVNIVPMMFILVFALFMIIVNYGNIEKYVAMKKFEKQLTEINVKITKTNPEEITSGKIFNPWEGQSSLGVSGENFFKESVIYVNEKPLNTSFGNPKFISTIIPSEMYKNSGKLEIQVKYVKKNKIINVSNKIFLNIKEKQNNTLSVENPKDVSKVNMKIIKTDPKEIIAGQIFNPWKGEAALGVFGEGFIKESVIYINGKSLNTSFGNSTFISAIVPNEMYKASGKLEVQVKYMENNKILNESNKVDINIK